jgi:hypothetical protein
MDIFNKRTDLVIQKFVSFVKRVFHNVTHTLGHVWDEIVKVGRGFRHFKNDLKYYISLKVPRKNYRYETHNYSQDVKIKQVKKDFMKFIPFSVFILIPGLELLLPAWLMIFPKSIPS